MDASVVKEITDKYKGTHGELISILEDVQDTYGYLPKEILIQVAGKTGRSLVDIYGIATFYRVFKLTPGGKHLISVCLGTACHVRGAQKVIEEFGRQLGISAGETTPDKEFTLETVNCLGACALGPIVMADGHCHSNVTAPLVKGILEKSRTGADQEGSGEDETHFPIEVNCPHCRHSLMDMEHSIHGRPSIVFSVQRGKNVKKAWLSSLYGNKTRIVSDNEGPQDAILELVCPYCRKGLANGSRCMVCATPMVEIDVEGGGWLEICSRKNCGHHMLNVGNRKDYNLTHA